jgi:two-component system, cell cycle response regulator
MRVLIVDDSAEIRAEVRRLLGEHGIEAQCLEAENGAVALRLAMQGIDLILCDVQMPEMDGFQFLRLFRARPETASTPVIMLTGRDVAEEKIFGLEAGASDYVTKPFIPGELLARVKVQLKIKALQDDLRQANDRLREVSITDYLTGVYNRRHFSELLAAEFKRAQRYKASLSLAILDIDHFKQVNDTNGHVAGDLVLSDFAHLLRHSFRATDVIARYGGEEFVVLLPHTSVEAAKIAVEKVRTQLKIHAIGALDRGALSFSAGVASYPSDSVDRPDVLVATADQALYQAKEAGRDRVVIFDAKAA